VDEHLARDVALKILRPEFTQQPEHRQRFLQEMRALGQIDHPHVVRAFEAGEHDGRLYLAMEYVEGSTFSDLLRSEPLPVHEVCELIRQAALGLEHLHQRGLVHRDIKPSNLMVTGERVAKLLDLGIARAMAAEGLDPDLTRAGEILGTLDYMAPEQQRGEKVDTRADIYALGWVLDELLVAALRGRPRDRFPIALQRVVRRMLARDPRQRYQAPSEVVAALKPFTRPPRMFLWRSLWR
jgi:serine/threonine protein kinase